MKSTESDPRAGGEFTFDAVESNVEVTLGDRLRAFYEEYVYEPAIVAWDDWRTRIGGGLLFVYLLIGTIGVWLYPAPSQNMVPQNRNVLEGGITNWPHAYEAPLGSTQAGIDLLSQAIHSTPTMLLMVVSGAFFATGIAVVIGTVAGYKGGRVDRIVTTFSDVAMAIPGLPLVVVIAFVWNPTSPFIIGPLIVVNYWAGLGRSIRSQVLTLREEEYVEASRTMGVGTPTIILKDILPNMMPFVLVNFAFAARYVVFASVGLFFLGVLPTGMQNWGLQLNRAYQNGALVGSGEQHEVFVPMVFIMLLGLSLVLLAQGLDRLFNPRVRTRLAGESESTEETEDDGFVGGGF